MWQRIKQWNTLRNQMLIGFLFVMIIVLFIAGIVTFNSVSTLLKDKAEKQIRQTAIQANGRMEALIDQIDTLTTQAVSDSYLQRLLLAEASGKQVNFDERQALMQIANKIQSYTSGVSSVEVYGRDYKRLYPLDDQSLAARLDWDWIGRANSEKGKLVWVGIDPKDRDSVLAIRRVNLIDRWFSGGGYLMVRIKRSYFEFRDQLPDNDHGEVMLLADQALKPIVSGGRDDVDLKELMRTGSQTISIGKQRYMLVKQPSAETGWTLMILYPVNDITEGISVLRVAIMASGAFGLVLFLLMSLLLSTMITRPILKLIKAMRKTRLGVLTPNPETYVTAEINDLNYTYNQMVDNINRLIKLVYEKEVMQSRTELKALQAQINPHFLYNTLEALYWSLQEKGEEDLSELVIAMSELFRYVIGSPSKDEWVTLRDELDHIERYLHIMSIRFGSRLTWEIITTPDCSGIKLPKLLIQPLVENAVLHGLEGKTGQGLITVRAERSISPSALTITVSDDGPGMEPHMLEAVRDAVDGGATPPGKGTGIGITSVGRRLKLYYSSFSEEHGGLRIESKRGIGTSISFEIPVDMEVPG